MTFHNGTESRETLPLWNRDRRAMPSRRPAGRVQLKRAFHNGTKSRETLPLWYRDKRAMPSRRPAGRVQLKRAFHNGTESREMLPLWQTRQANQAGRQQQSRLFRLFKVLRSAENGVDSPVDAHAVGIDHQVVLADVGPLAAGVAAVVVGTAGIDPLDFP